MDFSSEHTKNLLRVWHYAVQGARKYCLEEGFIQVHGAPELVGIAGACENVDTLFKVDFFGKQNYLTQSDQLFLELLTPTLHKTWAEIQSFRAEPEVDARHLCQFSLFEIEHLGDLQELLKNIHNILLSMVKSVATNCFSELKFFGRDGQALIEEIEGIKTITYREAIAILVPFFPDLKFGDDLKANHEAKLTELMGPLFVTLYELNLKFFNMRKNDLDPEVVNSADLLLPFAGESAGSAEREHEYETIVQRLKSSNMYKNLIELGGSDADFEWYLNAHKDKVIPLHSGAGIGLNRCIAYILGQDDIRNVTPFVVNREHIL